MKPRIIKINDHRFKWWIRKGHNRYASAYKVVIQSFFGYKYVFPINEVTSEYMGWDIDDEFGGRITPADIKRIIEQKELK